MGLGYLLLHKLNCALLLSFALVFSMACSKAYLFRVVDERPVIPRGKSPPYMIAWWICFGLLVAFFLLCGIALWVAVFASL